MIKIHICSHFHEDSTELIDTGTVNDFLCMYKPQGTVF